MIEIKNKKMPLKRKQLNILYSVMRLTRLKRREDDKGNKNKEQKS